MDMTIVYEAAFGARFPLPPKVASPSGQLTEYPALESYATNPKRRHDAKFQSTGSSSFDVYSLPQQPENTLRDDRNLKCVTKHTEDATSPREGFQPVNVSGVAVPFSVLHAIIEETDILDVLLLNCPDFPTLFNLVASCSAAKNAFERHSQGIINAMLKKLPGELQYLTLALIAFNDFRPGSPESIRELMKTWLDVKLSPTRALSPNPL